MESEREPWGWRAWVLRDYCGENATLHSEWDGKLQWVLSRGMTWFDICLSRMTSRCYVGHKVEQTRGTHTHKKPKWEDHVRNCWDPKDRTVPWARMVAVHVVIWSQTADVFWRQNPQGGTKKLNRKWKLYTHTIFFPKIFFFLIESSWLEVEAVLRWIVFWTLPASFCTCNFLQDAFESYTSFRA